MNENNLRLAELAQACSLGATWLELAAQGRAELSDLLEVALELRRVGGKNETRSLEILLNVFLVVEGYLTKSEWDKETWEKFLIDLISEYRQLNPQKSD